MASASSSPTSSVSSVFDVDEDELARILADHKQEIENMTPEERDEYDKKQAKLDAEQAKLDAEREAFEVSLREFSEDSSPPSQQSLTSIEEEFKDGNEAIMAGMSSSELADYREKMRLEKKVEEFLEEAGNALSVNGVFIKTKSKSFPSFTRQERLVIIDADGFEWFDKGNTERKLGSIPLGRIVGASDAGTWDKFKLFGVEISHPGIEEGSTFLWCKTPKEHDEVIATVNALVAQAREAANKGGGNKNRKTIIKYRKRRTIRKNKKGTRTTTRTTTRTRQRKNRTRTMRKKARKSRK